MSLVVVSGANGFIGRHAIKFLKGRGFEVHCVTSKDAPPITETDVIWHQVDLLNGKECSEFFETIAPTHLLHFAWYAEPGKYQSSDLNLEWVKASLHMLRDFHVNGGERATFAGTCFEYDLKYGFCVESITPTLPATFYGVCKNALREVAEQFCLKNQLSFSWGRIFFLYGPYEHPNRLVSSVIIGLLKGIDVKTSHGRQIRDYLCVEDVASAMAALLDSQVRGIVNIASGQPVAVRDLVTTVSDKIGKPELVKFGALPIPANDPPLILADVRRLNNEVRWHPRHSLDDGLDSTIAWWRARMKEESRE
jgi:nucleoside-diphosphate-sugar epimerase